MLRFASSIFFESLSKLSAEIDTVASPLCATFDYALPSLNEHGPATNRDYWRWEMEREGALRPRRQRAFV
jgi:hypothetical protein